MTSTAIATGSGLPLLAACRASAALPRVDRERGSKTLIGNALHDHFRDRVISGVSGAMEKVEDVADRWRLEGIPRDVFLARARHFEWSPPAGALPEIALCLLEDGSVVPVRGGRGHYPDLPGRPVVPAQIDVFWSEPEPLRIRGEAPDTRVICPEGAVLWVVDLKTGEERWVEPAEDNWQLKAEALLAARYTGAQYVVPAILYWRKGAGIWDVPKSAYGPDWLDAVERDVRSLLGEAAEQKARYARGEALDYRVGRWCQFCDSASFCPARTASLKRWMGDDLAPVPGQLTTAQAHELASLEPQFRAFHAQVVAALRSHVEATGQPIRLSDGRAWGPYVVERKGRIDTAMAERVLAEEVGPDLARAALRQEITQDAIEGAIRTSHAARGIKRQLTAATKRVMARLIEEGGVPVERRARVGLHVVQSDREVEDAASVAESASLRYLLEGGDVEIDGDD